jgi:rod shape-determining protein MreB
MIGRAPEKIELIRPVKDGHLDHYEMAGTLLLHFLGGPSRWRSLLRTKVVMGLPTEATKIQQLALQDALQRAGAGNVGFVSGIASAAVGAGIDPTQPGGWLLVDFGGGALDVAIVSMGGVVSGRCLRIGGLALDEAVGTHIRRRFNVTIGERTTEAIKIELGNAVPGREESLKFMTRQLQMHSGSSTAEALPRQVRQIYSPSPILTAAW